MIIKEGRTNIRYLLIVILLAVVAGGGILWLARTVLKEDRVYPISLRENLEIKTPDASIIYLKKEREGNLFSYDVLYSFNPATKEKRAIAKDNDEKITEGYKYYLIVSYSLSSGKNRVAYALEPLGGHPKTPLRIFNLVTSEDKLLYTFAQNPSLEIIGWSSDDKYLAIRWEKEFKGSFIKIIDSNTGEEKLSLEEPRDHYFKIKWLNNESLIYNPIQVSFEKEDKEINLSGIVTMNINGEQKILQQATELEDYYIVKVLDDGKILFSLEEVKSVDDWRIRPAGSETTYINSETTYWIMGQEGENLTQVSKDEVAVLAEEPDIRALLSKELLSDYSPGIFHQKSFFKDRNWWLFSMGQICPADALKCFPPDDIFIINVKDKKSLIKIDENVSLSGPDW